ncbi:hypothetical protein POTOM_008190 [Populus tomentosa]|uniref:Uncharacterized protein n=1 Tax=Populus tomentosa TaxID=118781 RepID=A0A8X8AE12_POPTO|nr:hypothetical protein POTOM_008190 [Populus tomentosa]
MEGFKQLWEHMQSMDRTSEKIAYGAGVAAGTVGGVAGVVCGTKMAFDWLIDRYDELETRSIERIMRKIDANRRDRNKGVSVASRSILTEPKSDVIIFIISFTIHPFIAKAEACNDIEALRRTRGKVQVQAVSCLFGQIDSEGRFELRI